MKRFNTPKINISIFESENVVTTSGAGTETTAVDQALQAANSGAIADSAGTLQVDLSE